jgi:hypothetical protein
MGCKCIRSAAHSSLVTQKMVGILTFVRVFHRHAHPEQPCVDLTAVECMRVCSSSSLIVHRRSSALVHVPASQRRFPDSESSRYRKSPPGGLSRRPLSSNFGIVSPCAAKPSMALFPLGRTPPRESGLGTFCCHFNPKHETSETWRDSGVRPCPPTGAPSLTPRAAPRPPSPQ